MHRVLDRIHDGKHTRDITPWMLDTLSTKGAAFALAADFATQPITSVAVGTCRCNGQRSEGGATRRQLQDSGTQMAGSLTYDTEDNASNGASGAKQLTTMANSRAHGARAAARQFDIHHEKKPPILLFGRYSALRKLLQNIPSLIHRSNSA